jgi:hypothetical protein
MDFTALAAVNFFLFRFLGTLKVNHRGRRGSQVFSLKCRAEREQGLPEITDCQSIQIEKLLCVQSGLGINCGDVWQFLAILAMASISYLVNTGNFVFLCIFCG